MPFKTPLMPRERSARSCACRALVVCAFCILTTLCMFLQELNNHENIIKLWNVLRADNDKDIYLVFECASHCTFHSQLSVPTPRVLITNARACRYMDTDLHHVIRANILEEVHKQYIMYQLLKSLKYPFPHHLPSRPPQLCKGTCTRRRCCTEI